MFYIKGTFKSFKWYTKETLISRASRSDKEKTVFVVGCFGERAGTCVTGCPLSGRRPMRNRPPFLCTPRVNWNKTTVEEKDKMKGQTDLIPQGMVKQSVNSIHLKKS